MMWFSLELDFAFRQFMQRVRNFYEILDKAVIIRRDTKKRSYLSHGTGWMPKLYSFDLFRIGLHSVSGDHMTQVLDFISKQDTLLCLGVVNILWSNLSMVNSFFHKL